MRVQVQRWGNSLAVRIPKAFAHEVNVQEGSILDLSVSRGRLVAVPQPPSPPSLEELLAGVTKSNLHTETDYGPPIGREPA